jgi:cysteine-rich repeat protein
MVGCPEFDQDLYLEAEATEESWEAIEDACPLPEQKILDSDVRAHGGVVFLNDLADDYQDIGKLTDMDGPEGVLGFRVASNERVALSAQFVTGTAESPPPVDLALWLTRACDTNAFVRRNQRCPVGAGETMWWQTNEPGAFFLGFDSKDYDQSMYSPQVELTVVYPRFGDGVLDPGETCDDGNLVDGDGCTHDGLTELTAPGGNPTQEVEPNNHPTAGNVVVLPAGEMIQIVGFIGGSCDHDFFLMQVPEGSFPRVTILRADGRECDEGTPQFRLEFNQTLFDNQEQTKLGDALIPALEGTGTNHCPQWDENSFAVSSLAAGQYVAEFKAFDQGQHEAFHYLMRIEMLEPTAGE